MPKKKKKEMPKTTAAQLSSIIKACRDIMRKDKGLNGDIDRLPMLTWIMFLKFLDDMEIIREHDAKLKGSRYIPTIQSPYRWRDWAAKEDGITGEDLIAFINNDECTRPNGSRGKGLFAYLRSLEGTGKQGDRRNVVATVFRGTINRMINGYLLRDVINKVNSIHFTSSEEIHTLSFLYESMLKEMRDAAGDGGEFYTPRAVIKFMVAVTAPKLGDTVLDPACGTGGFLAEAFEHIRKQCKTVQDNKILQYETIQGCEAKTLPYLLCQMNLLLHGLDAPNIDPGNSLRKPLKEIRDEERVDVILTNPPFGGEEEKGIQSNFPQDRQTSETALLFLQLIMKKLRRPGHLGKKGGQAAVVVPNGFMFGDGVCARIKEDLLNGFNVHTIVRLPNGVFTPYTPIPTNLIFFSTPGPTNVVWFYNLKPINGKKHYTKTKPIQNVDFSNLLSWWKNRIENENAWKTTKAKLEKDKYNLDKQHPSDSNEIEVEDHKVLISRILEKEETIHNALNKVARDLGNIK